MWLVVSVTVCTSVSTSTNKHPALLDDVHGMVRCSCEVMHPYSERVGRQAGNAWKSLSRSVET